MKKTYTIQIVLLSAIASAVYSQPVISPSKPIVAAGDSLQLTATGGSGTITWSLAPGSDGTINPLTGVYRAPANLVPAQKAGGCQVMPNNSVFNTKISAVPKHDSSDAWMSKIDKIQMISPYIDCAWGLNIADNNTPSVPMHFHVTPGTDGNYQMLSWPDLKIECGYFSQPLDNEDQHVVTINKNTCQLSEIYDPYPIHFNPTCDTCNAAGGLKYYGNSFDLPTNGGETDAAGMFLEPITLRLDDIKSGTIQHALRFTLTNNYTTRAQVWPATEYAYANSGYIPYGTRFRLKDTCNLSSYSPTARMILQALKDYGMFLADGGGDFQIGADIDVASDPDVRAAFREITSSTINQLDFEIVDESSLMVSPSSSEVKYNNPYVVPKDYALVLAKDSKGNTSTVSISLQAVTVGVPRTSVWIQSGTTYLFPSWVNGNSNQNVTWSMKPSLGTLNPSTGQYTAPSVTVPTTTVLTATSVANSSGKQDMQVTVMPAGVIRMDVGEESVAAQFTSAPLDPYDSNGNYGPDADGNYWWKDQAGEGEARAFIDGWYPRSDWPSTPDMGLYYTARFSFGNDMLYRFIVPNGKYKIHLMFANPNGSGTGTPGQYKFHIETQGQLVKKGIDLCDIINGCAYDLPGTVDIYPSVSDNNLYFALRTLLDSTQAGEPILNAFSITLDTISTSGIKNLTESNSVRLYPNPARDFLSIDVENSDGNSFTCYIYDAIGREYMKLSTIPVGTSVINTGDLSAGIYFVKIIDKNGNVQVSKFEKQ